MASGEWQRLAPDTQADRRRYLQGLLISHGAKPFARMEPRHIRALRDERAAQPASANGRLKALKALFKWAVAAGHARFNPVDGIPQLKVRTEGYHTWTPDEVQRYLDRWGPGTRQRLALTLLLYTGARKRDVLRLGPDNVRDGFIHFTTSKTSTPVVLPVLPPLRDELNSANPAVISGPFLRTSFGQPFTSAGFGKQFRKWARAAGVPGTPHGLRKAAATLAAENGATEAQLNAMFGWADASQEARRYTRAANKKRLAAEGAARLIVPPSGAGTEGGEKAS